MTPARGINYEPAPPRYRSIRIAALPKPRRSRKGTGMSPEELRAYKTAKQREYREAMRAGSHDG